MRRVGFFGQVIYVAIFFLSFVGVACVGFQRDDDPIIFALTFSSLFALAIAAVCLGAWVADRRARAAFAATLTEAERVGLRGFEALRGWASWREFTKVVQRSRPSRVTEWLGCRFRWALCSRSKQLVKT
jgi:hypothetical protein